MVFGVVTAVFLVTLPLGGAREKHTELIYAPEFAAFSAQAIRQLVHAVRTGQPLAQQ